MGTREKIRMMGAVTAVLTLAGLWPCSLVLAQGDQRGGRDAATLVVDGVVQRVFTGGGAPGESLVQIEVQRSDARRAASARAHFPAPGELVYVHVAAPPDSRRFDRSGGIGVVPAEQAQVRAYLSPRENGAWQAASSDWCEVISDRAPAASPPGRPAGTAADPSDRSQPSGLGMTYEQQTVSGRLVLRVKSIERGGAAQQAGIEVGDVIIGLGDNPLQSARQLEEVARAGGLLSLMVVDVNSSRPARVELRLARDSDTPSSTGATAAAPRRSLGLTAESVRTGLRTALKVVNVEAGSPAQKAGIEPDDILVAANGTPLTGPDQLGAALRKSGPTLTLTVRDSRTGKDVPVEVAIGGPVVPSSFPADEALIPASAGNLGAVTELSFYDVEVALKVTEVEPGSPAARAGLEPGNLIIAANGKPVLHPSELNAAVRNSNGSLRLSVVNPRTNKKETLQVNLGR